MASWVAVMMMPQEACMRVGDDVRDKTAGPNILWASAFAVTTFAKKGNMIPKSQSTFFLENQYL